MKNVYLLSTDKPSRLWTNNLRRRLELEKELFFGSNTAQHIYITNDEFIEDGDFGLNLSTKNIVQYDGIKGLDSYYKKIILTTDQDLIKDGVQAIDDEFLEWFVKNPSCEWVEVEVEFIQTPDNLKDGFYYKIIIPIEEPKQETLTYTEAAKKDERILNSNMLKQETLLQIANRKLMSNDWLKGAEFGAKWQAERMYSEEEVIAIVEKSRETGLTAEYLFLTEQFKKK
jgi:hypothetical protein